MVIWMVFSFHVCPYTHVQHLLELQANSLLPLSKVPQSFWSCTHVNKCQNYILYINLHIILNIYQILEKITRIDQKVKIDCVLLSH